MVSEKDTGSEKDPVKMNWEVRRVKQISENASGFFHFYFEIVLLLFAGYL